MSRKLPLGQGFVLPSLSLWHLHQRMQEEDENLELLFENLGLRHFGKMQLQPNLCVARTFLFISIFIGVLFSYSAFISKLMPDTGILVLDFMKHDYYFCYLFPLMLLPTYIVVYINWLAMKFFKNNWLSATVMELWKILHQFTKRYTNPQQIDVSSHSAFGCSQSDLVSEQTSICQYIDFSASRIPLLTS